MKLFTNESLKILLLVSLLSYNVVMISHGLQEEDSAKCNRLKITNCRKLKQRSGTKTVIYFGLMLSFPDPQGRPSFTSSFDNGHNIAPAAYLAVKQVNNESDLLKDYEIKLLRLDSGCDVHGHGRTAFALNELVCSCESIVGIIGPSCKESSKTVNQLTNREHFSIITINYGGQNARTGNYSYAFGILGTNSLYSMAFAELIKHNNWMNYAILYTAQHSDLSQNLISLSGFLPRYTSLIYADTFIPLTKVKQSYSRIIFVLAPSPIIARVLCLAYHRGIFFPDYQWIFHEAVQQDFAKMSFKYQERTYVCTDFMMDTSVNGSINLFLNAIQGGNDIDEDGEGNDVLDSYYEGYELETIEYSKEFGVNSTTTAWARGFYDALWALAYALNDSLVDLNTSLSELAVGSQTLAEGIKRHMFNLNFRGVTGNIKFDNNTGFNKEEFLNIFQYRKNQKARKVGIFKDRRLNISLNSSAYFIDSSFKEELEEISGIIVFGILVFTLVTLILLISAQIVNIRYRNHKGIKASSPMFNHLIFIGGYMIAIGVIIYSLETPLWVYYPVIGLHVCSLVPSLFSVGVTLYLGTVCVKTWRLNRIYVHSKRLNKEEIKSIKGYLLIGFLSTLVVTDILVCVLWRFVDPRSPRSISQDLKIGIGSGGERVMAIENICNSNHEVYWYTALLIPKVLLVVASFFLALLTQMNIKEFKTDNVIVLSFFLTAIFGLGIPLYAITIINYTGHGSINVSTTVLGVCLNIVICIGVCILLQPLWKSKCCNSH